MVALRYVKVAVKEDELVVEVVRWLTHVEDLIGYNDRSRVAYRSEQGGGLRQH